MHGYGMAFGGGGFAISYGLACELAMILDGCIERYHNFYGSDEKVSACVSDLGVPLAKEPDFHLIWDFPSWGLSQKLSRIIGANKAREVSMTAIPLTAEQGEKLGFVNYVVEVSEVMKKAQEIAVVIAKNNQV